MAPATVSKGWKIHEFTPETATPRKLADALIQDSGCFVRGLIPLQVMDQIEKDVRPYFQNDQPWLDKVAFPDKSRRVQGIVSRSRAWTESLIGNELYQDTANIILSSKIAYWYGDIRVENAHYPKLCSALGFSILPGAEAQGLHRDCTIHHNGLEEITPKQYRPGRDTQFGMFVGGNKGTKENGITRFVPRSHLWDMETKSCEDQAVYAEMEKGDAFFMLGSCYHGGSANNTKDEERLHENQFWSHSKETIASYDKRMQNIIGYRLSTPLLGWVDWRDPKALLVPEEEARAYGIGYIEDERVEYLNMPAETNRPEVTVT
ncbi:phytanoyl-CoA dioxygenase family protein [Eremomyces bilateralis CBS 781.70]|uniref:Phytanoyl-CoA dioxygenase family protein n=1 Tax=Eremomyces bilateralis CBS 781.70 TaxID=1392243 RepID=A0A6G1GHB0_9PEZI|nr:phytanoyl-CoA dioxygenase family protein [Eremomyces bilateralis CBS 781.70]KAF1817485.1 phytanoyl-CoA dioxygenase family protein [Eremomyces bilateralis CBS 781.70]